MSNGNNNGILEDLKPELEKLQFVEWDRFTVGEWGDQEYVTIYGWIDRDDEYKDFVVLLKWADGGTYYTTSSSDRTEEIHRVLFPNDSIEEHNDCQRVEDYVDIPNKVEIVGNEVGE